MRKVLLFVCLLMAGMTVNVNAAKQKAKHVILIGMSGVVGFFEADSQQFRFLFNNILLCCFT